MKIKEFLQQNVNENHHGNDEPPVILSAYRTECGYMAFAEDGSSYILIFFDEQGDPQVDADLGFVTKENAAGGVNEIARIIRAPTLD